VTGAPLWAKPLKFSISILVYALTLAWLLGLLRRWRRVGWWAGTVTAVFLGVEMVIIVGAAIAGTTSHFNVSTPFAAALWDTMALSIVIVWSAAVPVAVLLFHADLGDPARSLAIRAGLLITLAGMALAFLMTGPTAAQLADFRGIAGAHTVGMPDGGPGLPLLGWSTVAGDLRAPHFIGIHALQVLPLCALLLELAARRVPALRPPGTRLGIVIVGVALYVGVLVLPTLQALAGQSIVRPDPTIAATATALGVVAAIAVGVVIAVTNRRSGPASRVPAARHR